MGSVGTSAVKIIDNDSDVVSVTSNRLDVNAHVPDASRHSTIGHGKNQSVGTSAEALTTSTACKHVDIMASISNTGIIYVGGSGVAANSGIALYPGDVYSVEIDDLADIYVLASVNNEDVQWVYYN
jgi:hypothetical protein|tara:strand:- start:281 stop:658 length:378 start_codon:yes stop_codon:yes gene_type:complete